MSFVNFDLEEYPIVYITFNSAPRDSEDMEAYLAQFEGILIAAQAADPSMQTDSSLVERSSDEKAGPANAGVITFIIDLGELGIADNINMMLHLPAQINFIHKIHNVGLENIIAKTIIIVRNTIARSILNSTLSNITLRKPYTTAATKEEATDIAKGKSFS